MDKLLFIIGVGAIGSIILNIDTIKSNYLKHEAIQKSNRLVIDFFRKEIKSNPDITLKEAILKFEDINEEYNSLEDFSKNTGRDIDCYIKAYESLFKKAKNLNY